MDKLLTAKEVADLLHCHTQSVYKNSSIPRMHVPGVGVRFNSKDIEYLAKNSRSGPVLLDQVQYSKQLLSLHEAVLCDRKKSGGLREMAKAKSKSRYNFGYGAIYSRKTAQGNQRWYLDYYNEAGKRVQEVVKHAGCKEDAFVSLKAKVQSILKGRHCNGVGDVGFQEFSEEYLREYAMKRKRSWKSDQCYLRAHLVPFFGSMRLSEITRRNVEQYSSRRLEDGVSKSTINRELAVFRKMMFKAIDWGRLDSNPVQREDFFRGEDHAKERVLTSEEQERLLQECSASLRPILVAALNTGMRRGEILGLEWERVDLDNKLITLACTNTKNKKMRIVPINETLLTLLVTLKVASTGSKYVFPNPFTGKPMIDAKSAFYRACKKANVKGLRFHDLRHTFASRLSARGVDLNTIRELLGHGSIRMTQRYLHSDRAMKRSAVECLVDWGNDPSEFGPGLLRPRDILNSAQRVDPVSDSNLTN